MALPRFRVVHFLPYVPPLCYPLIRMIWYITSHLSNSNCNEQEIERFKDYYNFIKFELEEIKDTLSQFIGSDIAYTILLYVPDPIASYKIDHPIADESDDTTINWNNIKDSYFMDLARFVRTLPYGSKHHICEHCVKERLPNGTKQVLQVTQNKNHIQRLLADCVIVYTEYLDRNRASWPTKQIKKFVEPISEFIYERHHPLSAGNFENQRQYFAQMLEEYATETISRDT
eukprot:313125_1